METVTSHDGFTVTSQGETAEEMRAALAQPEPTTEDPAPEPEPEPEPKPAAVAKPAEPAKIDKSTRAGKKASIQQEIDALVGTKHHTEREVEAARTELQRLRSEQQQISQQRQEPAKPQAPQTFPSYQEMLAKNADLTPEQWLDQRDEWRDNRKAQMEMARSSEERHFKKVQALNGRIETIEVLEPGFWDTVKPYADRLVPARELQPGQQPTAINAIADVVLDSDIPDKFLRHFRDNPADFQRLSTLHPVQVFREMGKLEKSLEAATSTGPASKAPVVSQANPPLKPVSGSPVISDDDGTPEGDLPVDEFFRRRTAQERARRR